MKILFPSDVYKRLRAYVLAIETEISFLGKINKKDDTITIKDIVLLKQQSTYGSTILDKEALGQFYSDLMDRGEDPSPWKCWLHSHARMETFFSTKDLETIESFDLELPADNWFLSIVVNHAGSLRGRIDIFSPFRHTIDKLSWDIVFDDPALLEQAKQEISEKVTPISFHFNKQANWREELEKLRKRNLRGQILLPGEVD